MLKLLSSRMVIIREIIYFLNNFTQLLISINQKCTFKPVNIYYMLATLIRSNTLQLPVTFSCDIPWLFRNSHIGDKLLFLILSLSIPLPESTVRKRLITPRCTVFKKYQSERRMSLLATLQRLYHVHVTGIQHRRDRRCAHAFQFQQIQAG